MGIILRLRLYDLIVKMPLWTGIGKNGAGGAQMNNIIQYKVWFFAFALFFSAIFSMMPNHRPVDLICQGKISYFLKKSLYEFYINLLPHKSATL